MSKSFQEIIDRAVEVRGKYDRLNTEKYGGAWNVMERVLGFGGDYGQLAKLVMAKEGRRGYSGESSLDDALRHELADCLWDVMAIADKYDVDLEKAFLETMDELDARIERREG